MAQPASRRLVTEAALDTAIPAALRGSLAFNSGVINDASIIRPDQEWTAGVAVRYIRKGDNVALTVLDIGRAAASTSTLPLLGLPHKFRPAVDMYFTTWQGKKARLFASSGELQIYAPGTQADYLSLSYVTDRPYDV